MPASRHARSAGTPCRTAPETEGRSEYAINQQVLLFQHLVSSTQRDHTMTATCTPGHSAILQPSHFPCRNSRPNTMLQECPNIALPLNSTTPKESAVQSKGHPFNHEGLHICCATPVRTSFNHPPHLTMPSISDLNGSRIKLVGRVPPDHRPVTTLWFRRDPSFAHTTITNHGDFTTQKLFLRHVPASHVDFPSVDLLQGFFRHCEHLSAFVASSCQIRM
jgi:hypothetical protein